MTLKQLNDWAKANGVPETTEIWQDSGDFGIVPFGAFTPPKHIELATVSFRGDTTKYTWQERADKPLRTDAVEVEPRFMAIVVETL